MMAIGSARHESEHVARADTPTGRVRLLHSDTCVKSGLPREECEFTVAANRGVALVFDSWKDRLAVPVIVTIAGGVLVPVPVAE